MPLCLHTHPICIYCTQYHLLYLAYAALYHHSFIYLYVHILYPLTVVLELLVRLLVGITALSELEAQAFRYTRINIC